MKTSRVVKRNPSRLAICGVAMSLVVVCAVVVSAASYARITLKELTTRSMAVVEVEVIRNTFPPMTAGQAYPRTHVDLKVVRTLKGKLAENFQLDLPGGINGNVITHVPDAPDFKIGERAIVFVKEPEAGLFMVQDLGLGKYNLVERDGKTFVESPLCPKSIGVGKAVENQDDLDANLLTRSIPYPVFCSLVQTYAAGELPTAKPAELAARLAPSTVHAQKTELAAVTASKLAQQQAANRNAWLALAGVVVLSAVIAAIIVARRKKAKAASAKSVALVLAGALLSGALIGGVGAKAFVGFVQGTIWNLDSPLVGKVADNKIIWRQSTSSKNNANIFASVQQSFDRWASVDGSRLAFTAGGISPKVLATSQDTENLLLWSVTPSNDFSQNTLGIAFSSFTVGLTSSFVDGDIIFNDRDFDWSANGTGNSLSVSLHEIGHFIGLSHTTDNKTVMFPFDSGFTALSPDEVAAAIALYPSGLKTGTPVPPAPPVPPTEKPLLPMTVADASPKTGSPGTTVSFTSAGSAPVAANRPIVSFEWWFGDGVKGNGASVTHTYTATGTYTVMLQVTDSTGAVGTAMVTVVIGQSAEPLKAQFKLNFAKPGKDSFTASFSAADITTQLRAGTPRELVQGSLSIGDQPWNFVFDSVRGKSVNKNGVDVSFSAKTGLLTLKIKSAELRSILGGHGAVNETLSGVIVEVPVKVWFNDADSSYLYSKIQFIYTATENKSGSGKL